MKKALVGAALAAASLLGPATTAAQDLRTTDLGNGIHMLEGRGGNVGISAGEDGVFLIDDQFEHLTPAILAAVAKITEQPVRFLLNTHWHFDHVGGNENLGKAGVAIIAHHNVRKLMGADQVLTALARKIPAAPRVALPIITFDEGLTPHLNGETVHAFHVPAAHTNGDTMVHFVEADVIHMGDVYFNGRFPFIDKEHGGTIEGVVAAVDRALALAGPDTKIIPGHGPLSNKEELEVYRDMLAEIARKAPK